MPDPMGFNWEPVTVNGDPVGSMTICVFSPRMKKNIGYALVDRAVTPGAQVQVHRPGGPVAGVVQELPFLPGTTIHKNT